MIIEWFNDYSGVYVESEGRVVLFDPVDVFPSSYPKVDVIIITHEHEDHLDEALVKLLYDKTKCMVLSDTFSYRTLSKFIPKSHLKSLTPRSKAYLADFKIYTEKSNHPAYEPITVVLETPDGLRIYHSSDSLPFEEMAYIPKKYGLIDVAFCSVGIAPRSNPRTGAEIAKLIKPRIAIPYHGYKLKEFCSYLRSEDKITCMIIEKNKKITI